MDDNEDAKSVETKHEETINQEEPQKVDGGADSATKAEEDDPAMVAEPEAKDEPPKEEEKPDEKPAEEPAKVEEAPAKVEEAAQIEEAPK